MPSKARTTTTRGGAASSRTSAATATRATTRRAGEPRQTGASGRSPARPDHAADREAMAVGTEEQTQLAEDWYRLGVADAVAYEHEAVAASFRLPFLRVNVELPHRHRAAEAERVAARDERTGEAGMRLGPLAMPSPRKTAYYLGLGALAAFEVVEWPVAAAIAAGTWVAQHTRPEVPTVSPGPWDFLHHAGHLGHEHDGHGHNGHAAGDTTGRVAPARAKGPSSPARRRGVTGA